MGGQKNRRVRPSRGSRRGGARSPTARENEAVAAFARKLVFGDVPESQREHLVLLTPDPPNDVAAMHPEIQEMLDLTTRALFDDTGLFVEEQKILLLVLRRRRFSAFNAMMELLDRLPRVQDQIEELGRRGVPKQQLIAALLMTAQELQKRALDTLPGAKLALGQTKGRLRTFIRSAGILGIDPELIQLLEFNVEDKIRRIAIAESAIAKFTKATKHLARAAKTPLVHDPRIRVAELLVRQKFPPEEAFQKTAALLQAWHPNRFTGLSPLHIRRSFHRHHKKSSN